MVEITIIILAWLTLKEERSQKLDVQFGCYSDLQVSDALQRS